MVFWFVDCRAIEEAKMRKSSGLLMMIAALTAFQVMTPHARAGPPTSAEKASTPGDRKAAAAQGITPVNVLINGPACGHRVSPSRARLHTSTRDLLRWQVQNSCGHDQPVLVCVYGAQTKTLKNPFKPCTPDAAVHDIGKVFIVGGHGQAKFDCVAEDATLQGRYKKQVFVGAAEIPAAGCPATLQLTAVPGSHAPHSVFLHALDVEVVP
jgi:hypothetical protein